MRTRRQSEVLPGNGTRNRCNSNQRCRLPNAHPLQLHQITIDQRLRTGRAPILFVMEMRSESGRWKVDSAPLGCATDHANENIHVPK